MARPHPVMPKRMATSVTLGIMLQPKLDIKTTALLACIAVVLGLAIPLWTATQTIVAIESAHPERKALIIPMVVIVYLFTAIMPLFYFALYRNQGPVLLQRRLRLLSLTTAIAFGILVIAGTLEWIASLGSYSTTGATRTAAPDPRTISNASTLLSQLANIACILLLYALFRQAQDEPRVDIPVSKMFNVVTKVAVIAWGLWLAFSLVRVLLIPTGYIQLRDYALQIGQRPPQLARMMADGILTLLNQACLFAAPFIVYKGRR